MKKKFRHIPIELLDPPFTSPLVGLVIDLDYLRRKRLGGTASEETFYQLKSIFHTLESIGSARIEGNRTEIAEVIEAKIKTSASKNEAILEILNMENALAFIDKNIGGNKRKIDKAFLLELHKMVVDGLTPPPNGEGSRRPGKFRNTPVSITKSKVVNPHHLQVDEYMDSLLEYVNKEDPEKYDLLKIALAHHYFAWIHPFDNGNGRTVRLLTYAMLVRDGFRVDRGGRIINPTAIFCNNREEYYDYLAIADTGTTKGRTIWCEYVLSGLKREIEKLDKLMDHEYLLPKIILPSIDYVFQEKLITDTEAKILKIAARKQVFQAGDVKEEFPKKSKQDISRILRRLKEKKMIEPETGAKTKYVLRFVNNFLTRGIIDSLGKEDFLPKLPEKNKD